MKMYIYANAEKQASHPTVMAAIKLQMALNPLFIQPLRMKSYMYAAVKNLPTCLGVTAVIINNIEIQ